MTANPSGPIALPTQYLLGLEPEDGEGELSLGDVHHYFFRGVGGEAAGGFAYPELSRLVFSALLMV